MKDKTSKRKSLEEQTKDIIEEARKERAKQRATEKKSKARSKTPDEEEAETKVEEEPPKPKAKKAKAEKATTAEPKPEIKPATAPLDTLLAEIALTFKRLYKSEDGAKKLAIAVDLLEKVKEAYSLAGVVLYDVEVASDEPKPAPRKAPKPIEKAKAEPAKAPGKKLAAAAPSLGRKKAS